jgi:hypothetical protein
VQAGEACVIESLKSNMSESESCVKSNADDEA